MKPSFEKTVDVLVKAYLNDTLEHGKCSACAVGNLVADAMGTAPMRYLDPCVTGFLSSYFENGETVVWNDVFMTALNGQYQRPEFYSGNARRQIDSTGYTWNELARIEKAFEDAPGRCEDGLNDEWMFNGLMAVVDILADIHQVDLSVRESAKLLFVKP